MAFVAPTIFARPASLVRDTSFVHPLCAAPPGAALARPRGVRAPRMAGPVRTTKADTPRKQFLERLKPLRKVRIIVRNPVGILETIATFDGLFYADIPSGEYANLISHDINLDLHILLAGLSGARFEVGVSRSKSKAPTYSVRLLGQNREDVAVSVFVQWDKDPEDIADERIQAWKDLKADFVKGDGDTFFFDD